MKGERGMKKTISCLAAGAFVSAMLISGSQAKASANPAAASAYQPYSPQQGYYPNEQWAVPPSQWQAAEQKGFREGVRGAYKDAQNHRQPNVENRDEFRHPDRDDIPGGDIRAYREGFQRGYWTGVRHLMGYYNGPNPYQDQGYQQYGAPPQQGYYPNEQWAVPPGEWQAIQQRGFRDGVRGAYKDAQNHRPPNVENRDEYRHPDDVPSQDRHEYREAFRRGYWTGVRHLMGYYHGQYPDYDRR